MLRILVSLVAALSFATPLTVYDDQLHSSTALISQQCEQHKRQAQIVIATFNRGGPLVEYHLYGTKHGPS